MSIPTSKKPAKWSLPGTALFGGLVSWKYYVMVACVVLCCMHYCLSSQVFLHACMHACMHAWMHRLLLCHASYIS
jgi:hypothetical protein